MKKLALLTVLVVAFALMGGVALAAETPHGPFDANSAVCAACHRAHTSSAEYLLSTPRVTGLCIACHDGSGADTNVVGGAYVVNGTQVDKNDNTPPLTPMDNGYNHGTWGSADFALMGGGFLNVGYDGATSVTTSKHMDPTGGTAVTTYGLQFGAGAETNSPGTAKPFLDCVDCHMPHRSPNYRMLRVKPTGYAGANLSVPQASRVASQNVVVDNTPFPGDGSEEADYAGGNVGRRYTEDSGMFNYTISNPTAANAEGMSKWCGLGCHDFYYRSAVRGNNGEVANPSPAMQVRISTTVPAASQPVSNLEVSSTSGMVANTTYVWIRGTRYLVTALLVAPVRITVSPQFNQGTDLIAGTPVSIEGQGMEVYYDLDPNTGQDPNFMHAIDVDLNYYPRNLSSGVQNLAGNLAIGGYGNKMPVADMTNNMTYENTDRMTCLTCHRAHGSDVTMSDEASIAARTIGGDRVPAGIAFPAGADSMLLRLENRAVCQQCHQMPTGF